MCICEKNKQKILQKNSCWIPRATSLRNFTDGVTMLSLKHQRTCSCFKPFRAYEKLFTMETFPSLDVYTKKKKKKIGCIEIVLKSVYVEDFAKQASNIQ